MEAKIKTPSPPDPMKTAQAQGQMNRETAITQAQLAMMNQVTPFGSLTYEQTGYWGDGGPVSAATQPAQTAATGRARPGDPGFVPNYARGMYGDSLGPYGAADEYGGTSRGGVPTSQGGGGAGGKLFGDSPTPRYQATQTLSPEMQRIVDNLMGGAGNLTNQIVRGTQTPLSFDNLPEMQGVDRSDIQMSVGSDDFSADRQRVEEALFSRLNPQIERDRAALTTQLFNQGVQPGTEAYREAMAGLDRSIADQRSQIVLAGGQEQSRLFDMALQSGVFANTAQAQDFDQQMAEAGLSMQQRQQIMQEMVTERQQPINELAALLSSTQMQQPNFVNTPQVPVAGVDYSGLVQDNYNARLQQSQAAMGGLFGLASAGIGALPFSDERLKENKKRIGKTDGGVPIYSYNYKGDPTPQVGVMAQELERKQPEAVHRGVFGLRQVDYSQVH